jgi:Zn ribbon nucleic-acid-binding protein
MEFEELGKGIIVELISEVILLAVFMILGYLFSPNISEILGIHVSSWQTLLLLVFALVIILILSRILSIRQRIRRANRKVITVIHKRPRYIAKQIELEYFGVKWRALLGSLFRGDFVDGDYYVFIEGPFCPQCNFALIRKTKSKWKGLSISNIWHCVPCGKDYERPKDYLYEEDEIVEKFVESKIRNA